MSGGITECEEINVIKKMGWCQNLVSGIRFSRKVAFWQKFASGERESLVDMEQEVSVPGKGKANAKSWRL